MTNKDILNLAVTGESLALAGHNYKLAEKGWKKGLSTKDIVGTGVKNIVGVSLIKSQADIIGSM